MKVDFGWGPCLVTPDNSLRGIYRWRYFANGKWRACNEYQNQLCNEIWEKIMS